MVRAAPAEQQLSIRFSQHEPFRIEFSSLSLRREFLRSQKRMGIRQGIVDYLDTLQHLTWQHVPHQLQPALPVHFRQASRALVSIARDGVAIQFEPQHDSLFNEAFVLRSVAGLSEVLPQMTLGYVVLGDHQGAPRPDEPLAPPSFKIEARNEDGSSRQTLVESQIRHVIALRNDSVSPESQHSPGVELIRNHFEIQLQGIQLQTNDSSIGRPFMTRAKGRFPGFWDAISVYQGLSLIAWKQEDYLQWAERHFYQIAFQAASTEFSWLLVASQSRLRDHYARVLDEFDALLATPGIREEELQQCIGRHPELLSVGFKRVIPKLALGAHVTDFVVEDATGEYLLVEIESPDDSLFVKSGHQSAKLTHALGQVDDWVRYIQDNKSTVERELGLERISATPKALVVIGRSHSLTTEERRKLQLGQSKTEVLTYDDLRLRFARTVSNLLGMISNAQGSDFALM